jgi:hypothetical protein
MSKRRRAFSSKGLEMRGADLVGDSGAVSLHGKKPNQEVFYLLTLTIGMAGETGTSLFYATLATPEALRARAPDKATVISSRAMIIVSEYDWPTIEAHLTVVLKACAAPTWQDATERLLRYFSWEYENTHDAARNLVLAQTR